MNRIIYTEDGAKFRKMVNTISRQVDPDINNNKHAIHRTSASPEQVSLFKQCGKNIKIINQTLWKKVNLEKDLTTSLNKTLVMKSKMLVQANDLAAQKMDVTIDPQIDMSRFGPQSKRQTVKEANKFDSFLVPILKNSSNESLRKTSRSIKGGEQNPYQILQRTQNDNDELDHQLKNESDDEDLSLNYVGIKGKKKKQALQMRALIKKAQYDNQRLATSRKLQESRNHELPNLYFPGEDEFLKEFKDYGQTELEDTINLVENQDERQNRAILGYSSHKYCKEWIKLRNLNKSQESSDKRLLRIKEQMAALQKNYRQRQVPTQVQEDTKNITMEFDNNPLLKFLIQISPSKRLSLKNIQERFLTSKQKGLQSK